MVSISQRRSGVTAAVGFLSVVFLAAFVMALFAPTHEAEASSCAAAVKVCARSAAKLGAKTASTISACEAVRECRQDCRAVKRSSASACRGDKAACVNSCRAKHGRGRDFRACRRSCRAEKRGCKRDARVEKRSCRRVCRSTFLTPACRRARLKVLGSSLRTVAACSLVATCAKPAP